MKISHWVESERVVLEEFQDWWFYQNGFDPERFPLDLPFEKWVKIYNLWADA